MHGALGTRRPSRVAVRGLCSLLVLQPPLVPAWWGQGVGSSPPFTLNVSEFLHRHIHDPSVPSP